MLLDGELYSKEITFNILNGLTNLKQITKEQDEMVKKVKYYIFDCFDTNKMSLTMKMRKELIKSLINKKY